MLDQLVLDDSADQGPAGQVLNTRIVALMNGLGVEERLAESFDAGRIFGGMAFVCLNRGKPGVVHHFDYGRVAIGHMLDDPAETDAIARLFREAGVETLAAANLRQARWEKLVWNIPFNTLSVTAGGISTRRILDDEGLRGLAHALMIETIEAANRDGCTIDARPLIEKMFDNTATMGHYKTSMLMDYEARRPMEVDPIVGEPVRRATRTGLKVPHMAMQCHLLAMLDRLNRGQITPYEEEQKTENRK